MRSRPPTAPKSSRWLRLKQAAPICMRSSASPHPNPAPLAGEGVSMKRSRPIDPPPLAGEGGEPPSGERVGAKQDVDARADPRIKSGDGQGDFGLAGEGLVTGGTVGEALDETAAALAAAGLDEPRRQARRIFVAALGLSPAEGFAHPQRSLDREGHARSAAMACRVATCGQRSGMTSLREPRGLA